MKKEPTQPKDNTFMTLDESGHFQFISPDECLRFMDWFNKETKRIYRKGFREGFRAGSHFKKNNQEILLDYMKGYEAKNGVSPTLQEMKTAIACKSLTSVQRALVSLEKQGLVTRDKYQKRAWRTNAKPSLPSNKNY